MLTSIYVKTIQPAYLRLSKNLGKPGKIVVENWTSYHVVPVRNLRCPVCGELEASVDNWCDPRPEMDCDD